MTITPLRSRTEAISKIPTPETPKQCKSLWCGKLFIIVLPRPTEVIETYSRANKER